MKKNIMNRSMLPILILFVFSTGCHEDQSQLVKIQIPETSKPRTVSFELYTTQDFSNYENDITFTLTIRNSSTRVLFDSVLAPMQVKDIPDFNNKWRVEKIVPEGDTSELTVGFTYYLKNVGYSWYLDTCRSGTQHKVVSYDFR